MIYKPIDLSNAVVTCSDFISINLLIISMRNFSADKTLLISMCCFSRMLISNVHKSIIVMNSRFSRNVFEALQKTLSTCFIGSKTIRL